MGTGNQDTKRFFCILHFQDIDLNPLADTQSFGLDLLILIQDAICFSEVDRNALIIKALHNTGCDVLFLCQEFFVNIVFFPFSQILHQNVFCVLCRYTAEFFGFSRQADHISNLALRIDFSGILQRDLQQSIFNLVYNGFLRINEKLSCLFIDFCKDILSSQNAVFFFLVLVFISGNQCIFDRAENRLLTDVFFFFQDFQCFH